MVRDQALALSGLLSQKIGGPSVFPPQPDGLWQAAFNGERTWSTSQGEDRYRRGLYTFWRRTVPYPSMAVFDAPSREICAIRRVRTNTPLQSLVTLNDPGLCRGRPGPGAADRPRRGYERHVARPPRTCSSACAGRRGPSRSSHWSPSTPRNMSDTAKPDGRRPGPGHRPARAASARHGTGRSGCLDHRRQRTLESRFAS